MLVRYVQLLTVLRVRSHIIPMLQMKNMRPRNVLWISQGYIAKKWQSLDSHPVFCFFFKLIFDSVSGPLCHAVCHVTVQHLILLPSQWGLLCREVLLKFQFWIWFFGEEMINFVSMSVLINYFQQVFRMQAYLLYIKFNFIFNINIIYYIQFCMHRSIKCNI